MSNFSRIRAENQFVFFNTGLAFGINSLNIQNNFGSSEIKYIGIGNRDINQSVNSAQYADLNVGANFIHEDVFIQQTGNQPINCFIFQDTTNANSCYSLVSGYLNSYSAKYVANQPPQINSSLRFFKEAGNISQSNLDSYSSGQISSIISNGNIGFNSNVADTNYINLELDEYNTNRIQDFSFSVNYNRLPVFNVGSRFPKRIETIFPVNVTCNISFEAKNNFLDLPLTDFPLNKKQQTINLAVYSNRTNNLMATYRFKNMSLISNDRSINSDGNLIINRGYVGQLFTFTNLSGVAGPNILDFGYSIATPDFFLDFGYSNQPYTSQIDWGTI